MTKIWSHSEILPVPLLLKTSKFYLFCCLLLYHFYITFSMFFSGSSFCSAATGILTYFNTQLFIFFILLSSLVCPKFIDNFPYDLMVSCFHCSYAVFPCFF